MHHLSHMDLCFTIKLLRILSNDVSFSAILMISFVQQKQKTKNKNKSIIALHPEAATGGVLQEKVFLEISQNLQENTCARVSF